MLSGILKIIIFFYCIFLIISIKQGMCYQSKGYQIKRKRRNFFKGHPGCLGENSVSFHIVTLHLYIPCLFKPETYNRYIRWTSLDMECTA